MATCQCHPCGESFTGLGPFDAHQDVDYSRTPPVICRDPETLGMVQNDYGRWGYPMTEERRDQLQALRDAGGKHAAAV